MKPMSLLLLAFWLLNLSGSIAWYLYEEPPAMAGQPIAFLAEHTGRVEYRAPDFSVWATAQSNQGFAKGTTIATSDQATARVLIGEKHVLNIRENSQVIIGDPSELKPRGELFVNVLRGNLVVDSTKTNDAKTKLSKQLDPLIKEVPRAQSLVIASGTVQTTVQMSDESVLSVKKDTDKPAAVEAIRGGAVVEDTSKGTKSVIGDKPKPTPKPLLSFVLPDVLLPKVDLEPPAPETPAPQPAAPAADFKGYLNGFTTGQGPAQRTIFTFAQLGTPIKLMARFEHPSDPFWKSEQVPPTLRLAAGDVIIPGAFSRDTTAGVTRIEHQFDLTPQDTEKLRREGEVNVNVRPAVEGAPQDVPIFGQKGSDYTIYALQHPRLSQLVVRVTEPKVDRRPEAELPTEFENPPKPLSRTAALGVQQHDRVALGFVHRLVAGSARFDIRSKNDAGTALQMFRDSQNPALHVVKGGKTLLTLAASDPRTKLSVARQALRQLSADILHSGSENEAFLWNSAPQDTWNSLLTKKKVLAYCGSANSNRTVTLSSTLLSKFPDSKRLLAASCSYGFKVSDTIEFLESGRGE